VHLPVRPSTPRRDDRPGSRELTIGPLAHTVYALAACCSYRRRYCFRGMGDEATAQALRNRGLMSGASSPGRPWRESPSPQRHSTHPAAESTGSATGWLGHGHRPVSDRDRDRAVHVRQGRSTCGPSLFLARPFASCSRASGRVLHPISARSSSTAIGIPDRRATVALAAGSPSYGRPAPPRARRNRRST